MSVIVPARDEETALEHLLHSLQAQTAVPSEVVVVDDGSSDGTAAAARGGGAQVISGTGPPPGWTGKAWACHQGANAARGEILVFLDADVELAPNALLHLLAEHWWLGSGLVSVAPFHTTRRPYERLSAAGNLVALMGTGAFGLFPSRRLALAFGSCLTTSRRDYRRVGGHAHPDVRGRIAEDIALAGRYRAAGLPVRLLAGRGMVSYRMYPGGPAQLVQGWTRVLAVGARSARPPVLGATAVWVAAGLASVGAAARAMVGRRPGRATAIYGAFSLQMWWMLRRAGRFGAATWLLYPIPLATFVALFARSGAQLLLGRPARWRGRRLANR